MGNDTSTRKQNLRKVKEAVEELQRQNRPVNVPNIKNITGLNGISVHSWLAVLDELNIINYKILSTDFSSACSYFERLSDSEKKEFFRNYKLMETLNNEQK
jgi:hypothetical protein